MCVIIIIFIISDMILPWMVDSRSGFASPSRAAYLSRRSDGTTCLTLLVQCGLGCFMRCLECQGSLCFATLFATAEDRVCWTSSVRQVVPHEPVFVNMITITITINITINMTIDFT